MKRFPWEHDRTSHAIEQAGESRYEDPSVFEEPEDEGYAAPSPRRQDAEDAHGGFPDAHALAERGRHGEPQTLRDHVSHQHETDFGGPNPDSSAAFGALLPRLLREAADTIKTAETRAQAREQKMAEAIRAALIRAEQAEARAKAAEDLMRQLEQRAVAAVRAAERRAEVAEARVKAAESWIERVRGVVGSGPSEAETLPNGEVRETRAA